MLILLCLPVFRISVLAEPLLRRYEWVTELARTDGAENRMRSCPACAPKFQQDELTAQFEIGLKRPTAIAIHSPTRRSR